MLDNKIKLDIYEEILPIFEGKENDFGLCFSICNILYYKYNIFSDYEDLQNSYFPEIKTALNGRAYLEYKERIQLIKQQIKILENEIGT